MDDFVRTGATTFVVGANLPWIGYGTDVGASAWFPGGGLSAQAPARDLLERTFAALAGDGVVIVRTFLLCDARSGVRFDGSGVPTGLDDAVFPDIDALLAAAGRHGIRLIPVLLDFHLCLSPRIAGDVQLGGRSHLLVDPEARRALVDLVLRPIVERYGDDEAIAAWDVMNEPEWCLGGGPVPRRRRVAFGALQDFLGQAVRCVRESARPTGHDWLRRHHSSRTGAAARPGFLSDSLVRTLRMGRARAAGRRAGSWRSPRDPRRVPRPEPIRCGGARRREACRLRRRPRVVGPG